MLNLKLVSGLILLGLILILAAGGSFAAKALFPGEEPLGIGSYTPGEQPSPDHPFGVDLSGRDGLAVFLNSIYMSLTIGLVAGVIATTIGVVVGFISGFIGGITDTILRIITDMYLVFPTLALLLVLSIYIRNWNLFTMGTLLGLFSWPFAARTIRAQVLSLSQRPYVNLARMNSENLFEIIFTELMPSLLPYILLSMSGSIIGAILSETGLQFIGIGAQNLPTLGLMLADGFRYGFFSIKLGIQMLAPGLLLVVMFLCFNLINMGLEERFNPRLLTTAKES